MGRKLDVGIKEGIRKIKNQIEILMRLIEQILALNFQIDANYSHN